MAHKYAYRSEHFAKFFKEDQANRGLALIFVYFKLWSTSQVKNEAYEHDIVDTLDRLLSGFPHGVGQTQRRVFLACHQLRLDFMQKGDKEKFRAARRHFYEVMELEQQVDDNKNCWDGIVKFMKPIKRFYTENGFTDE